MNADAAEKPELPAVFSIIELEYLFLQDMLSYVKKTDNFQYSAMYHR